MTYNPTLKQFVAKLLGVGAAASALPKLFAKSASSNTAALSSTGAQKARSVVEIRHDTRAVARRDVV